MPAPEAVPELFPDKPAFLLTIPEQVYSMRPLSRFPEGIVESPCTVFASLFPPGGILC